MSETFCPNCQTYSETRVETREETYKVRGKDVTMPVEVEVCLSCGETIFDETRDSDLLRRVYAAYREQEGLLTPEQIRGIRKRYSLSQESFASLLGMSQATINRYEKGGLQNQSHDAAIRACMNAQFVRDLLERKGHLLTDWQRRRAEEALAGQVKESKDWLESRGETDWFRMPSEITERTGFRRFDYKRFAAVAVWFCRRRQAVSRTVINKLLFYADFLHYRTTTVSLTGAAYRKIPFGPAPTAYDALLSRMEFEGVLVSEEVEYPGGYTGTDYRAGPDTATVVVEFTARELAVLERVAGAFQGFSAKRISDHSHQESAYRNTPDKEMISYQEAMHLSLAMPEQV